MELKPLITFPAGSVLRVEQLSDCPRQRCRLCALGLTPGTLVEIVANNGGPSRIKVRGSDLALGRGMGSKILCRAVDPAQARALEHAEEATDQTDVAEGVTQTWPDTCAACPPRGPRRFHRH